MKSYQCATCGKTFMRYPMNATRAAKPQYCSQDCVSVVLKERAERNEFERLMKRIKKGDDNQCWEWQGRRDPRGYGRIDIGGRPMLAHRIAFRFANGYECENVCHSCDNPPCCNPSHLWPGNPKLNAEDREVKGRGIHVTPKPGELNPASKLTEEQARYILASTKTLRALAAKFGVSATAIRYVRIGRNWPHLQGK